MARSVVCVVQEVSIVCDDLIKCIAGLVLALANRRRHHNNVEVSTCHVSGALNRFRVKREVCVLLEHLLDRVPPTRLGRIPAASDMRKIIEESKSLLGRGLITSRFEHAKSFII